MHLRTQLAIRNKQDKQEELKIKSNAIKYY